MTFALTMLFNIHFAEAAMTYEKALLYQQKNAEDITSVVKKVKDIYGEKNNSRKFAMLGGSRGLLHSGNTIVGMADRTCLNYYVNYGFANIPSEPYAYISWMADLAGDPSNGYEPKTLQIVFEDNYIKRFSLQGWEYRREFIHGFLINSWAHNYDGSIKLSKFDIYEMSLHGQILAVSIDAGNGGIKHFFYSGDKDIKEKQTLTRAITHSMKMLDIDADTIKQEYEALKIKQEKERVAKIKDEVRKEIEEDAEREAIKKQILEEMKQKEANNNASVGSNI